METLDKVTLKYRMWIKDPNERKMVCGYCKTEKDGKVYYHGNANQWEKSYGIKRGEEITISHLMALLFYLLFLN